MWSVVDRNVIWRIPVLKTQKWSVLHRVCEALLHQEHMVLTVELKAHSATTETTQPTAAIRREFRNSECFRRSQ